MTTQQAKKIVRENLLSLGIDQYFKLTGKTWDFSDLARCSRIVITAKRIDKSWFITDKAHDVIKSAAKENGFSVVFE